MYQSCLSSLICTHTWLNASSKDRPEDQRDLLLAPEEAASNDGTEIQATPLRVIQETGSCQQLRLLGIIIKESAVVASGTMFTKGSFTSCLSVSVGRTVARALGEGETKQSLSPAGDAAVSTVSTLLSQQSQHSHDQQSPLGSLLLLFLGHF